MCIVHDPEISLPVFPSKSHVDNIPGVFYNLLLHNNVPIDIVV